MRVLNALKWSRCAAVLAVCAGTASGVGQIVDCDMDGFDDALSSLLWVPNGATAGFGVPGSWSNPLISQTLPQPFSVCVFDPGLALGTRALVQGSQEIRGLEVASGSVLLEMVSGGFLNVTGDLAGCREVAVGTAVGQPATMGVFGVGEFAAERLVLGVAAGADGVVDVFGAPAVFDAGFGEVVLGVEASGRLDVNASVVRVRGPVLTGVGVGPGSIGELNVVGGQLDFVPNAQRSLVLGAAGEGRLAVLGGGAVTSFGVPMDLVLGAESGATGRLRVSGSGSVMSGPFGSFEVGVGGHGFVDVDGLGVLETETGSPVRLASGPGSSAEVTLSFGEWRETGSPVWIGVEGSARVVVGEGALFEASAVSVLRRGRLAGRGDVRGRVEVVGGSVRPGVGPGVGRVLMVDGEVAFAGIEPVGQMIERGRLEIGLDGFGAGGSDALVVTGMAELAGTLAVIGPATGVPVVGQSRVVLIADLGVSGVFDAVSVPAFDGGTTLNVDYLPGAVEVSVVPRNGADPTFDGPDGFDSGAPAAIVDAVSGDVTGDGLADLLVLSRGAVAGDEGRLTVLENLGVDGVTGAWLGYGPGVSFSTFESDPVALGLGNLDGDEFADAYFVSRDPNGFGVVRARFNSPTNPGDFSQATQQGVLIENMPVDLAVGDLNGDGIDDAAVAGTVAGRVGGEAGGPAGRMTVTGRVTSVRLDTFEDDDIDVGVQPGSIDTYGGDNVSGASDIAVTCVGEGMVFALQNDGAGGFPTVDVEAVGANPTAVDAADLDGDGLADLLTSDTDSGTVSVVRSQPGSSPIAFDPSVSLLTDDAPGSEPRSGVFVDLDDDGDLDIAVIARDDGGVPRVRRLLFEGVGDSDELVFLEVADAAPPVPGEPEPVQLLTDDVDGDGFEDLIVVYGDGGEVAARLVTPLSDADVSVRLNSTGACAADIVPPFGVLDLSDIDAFVAGFVANDPIADVAAPFGLLDLVDIDTFIVSFGAGCP